MLEEFKETIKRWYNKMRIKVLHIFTDRVQHFDVKDEEGNTHRVTVEREKEKVCQHKRIKEVTNTLWQCCDCPDVYFQINYKVMLTTPQLVQYLSEIADHLKMDVKDK